MQRRFPVSNTGLAEAFDFLTASLDRKGRGEALMHRFSVILDEICANMIRHDPTLGEDDEFELELTMAEGGAVLVISDPGQPFDPLAFRHTEQPEIGGHGITLIKGLASAIRYERRDDWNRLIVSIELD